MATRKVQTPGATEPVEEVQQELVEAPAQEQVEEVQEPTNEELLAQIEQLKQQLATQPTPTVQAVGTAKRTRAVVGPNGWTTEEY